MRNIKKALLGCCMVIVIIIGLQVAARCCYEKWSLVKVSSMREREELAGTLDTLYCGTSLTYRAFKPGYLDEQLGTNSFNLGTASQPIIGTYYLIRDVVEKNPVDHIYYVVSLPMLKKEKTATGNYLSAFEYQSSWKWKMAYLSAVLDDDFWTSALFYTTQVENFFDLQGVKENLVKKYIEEAVPNSYKDRGYRGSNKEYGGRKKKKNKTIHRWSAKKGESQLQEEAYTYLQKMAEFCNEEGIQLTWVVTPLTQDYINGMGDVQDFQQFLADKADAWNVELFDFTLYKGLEDIFTNDKFEDVHHLNNTGAEAFCNALIEIEKSENPQEFFYEIDEME